jgi:hypothetical protein
MKGGMLQCSMHLWGLLPSCRLSLIRSNLYFKLIFKQVGFGLIAKLITLAIVTALPFVLGPLTGVLAYLQGLPWTHVLIAGSFVFAATATGILRISEYRFRVTPLNKLIFQGIVPAVNFIKDGRNGKNKGFERVQPGILLTNTAHVPISYKVEDIETSFEGMLNPKPDRKFRGTILEPIVPSIFKDAPIDAKNMQIDKTLYDGRIKFKLKYGFPGQERYYIEKDLNVNIAYDHKTGNFMVI